MKPRYYFRRGSVTVLDEEGVELADEEGVELADLKELSREAVRRATEIEAAKL